MRTRTIISLSLSALLLLGIGLFFVTKKPQQPPNIILISIDTWRNDYFTPEYMPLLYDFASKNCKIFTNAHSNSTWTKPSHLTMLTGLLQSEHGVEHEKSFIPPTMTMVQNRLKEAGYTTVGFVGGGFVSWEWGFNRGFDTYWQVSSIRKDVKNKERTFGETYRRSKESFDEAERYLSSNPKQPVFLFLHTYLVHEYWVLYFPQDRVISEVAEELRRDKRFAEVDRPSLEKFKNDASTEERRKLYTYAIKDCDKQLSRFLSVLERSPIFSNAKVIITSDHGEGLGEIHEGYVDTMHVDSPYVDQTHVPMIVYGLGVGKDDRLVGVDDIAGTILKVAGVEKDPAKSLFQNRDFIISEFTFPREQPGRALAVITDDEEFLLAKDGNLRLFRDAGDHDDLIDSHVSPFVGWAAIEGLEEGSDPQGDTPVVRWAYGPRTILKFIGDGRPALLVLDFRRNEDPDQTFSISLNGKRLEKFEFGSKTKFQYLELPLQTINGENTLKFEYSRMQGDRKLTVCFDRIMVLPEPVDRYLAERLHEIQAQRYPFTGWNKATGLRPETGPFRGGNPPVIRWGLGPRTELYFESTGEPLTLSAVCRPNQIRGQEVTIRLNGLQISKLDFKTPHVFEDIDIPINPRFGVNRLTFDYLTWSKSDPDFPMALEFKQLRIVPQNRAAVSESVENDT